MWYVSDHNTPKTPESVTASQMDDLLEQLRIRNLIALANSTHPYLKDQVAHDATTALVELHTLKDEETGEALNWYEIQPDIKATLGIVTQVFNNIEHTQNESPYIAKHGEY